MGEHSASIERIQAIGQAARAQMDARTEQLRQAALAGDPNATFHLKMLVLESNGRNPLNRFNLPNSTPESVGALLQSVSLDGMQVPKSREEIIRENLRIAYQVFIQNPHMLTPLQFAQQIRSQNPEIQIDPERILAEFDRIAKAEGSPTVAEALLNHIALWIKEHNVESRPYSEIREVLLRAGFHTVVGWLESGRHFRQFLIDSVGSNPKPNENPQEVISHQRVGELVQEFLNTQNGTLNSLADVYQYIKDILPQLEWGQFTSIIRSFGRNNPIIPIMALRQRFDGLSLGYSEQHSSEIQKSFGSLGKETRQKIIRISALANAGVDYLTMR